MLVPVKPSGSIRVSEVNDSLQAVLKNRLLQLVKLAQRLRSGISNTVITKYLHLQFQSGTNYNKMALKVFALLFSSRPISPLVQY